MAFFNTVINITTVTTVIIIVAFIIVFEYSIILNITVIIIITITHRQQLLPPLLLYRFTPLNADKGKGSRKKT